MQIKGASFLLSGVVLVALHACGGQAVIDEPLDTTTTSATGTGANGSGVGGSGASGASGTTSVTSVGPGPGSTAVSTTGVGAGGPCISCGDYINGFLSGMAPDVQTLCGFSGIAPGNDIICETASSCELLAALQACTCSACFGECQATCGGMGNDSGDCNDCQISAATAGTCVPEFNGCISDI